MLTAPPSLPLPGAGRPSPTAPPLAWPLPAPFPAHGEGGAAPAPRLPPALTVTPSELMYRGEGADHVVLGLRKLGRVVRLRKTSIGSGVGREELVRRAAQDQEVLARVGRPVLGRLLTDAAHLVLVCPRPDSALCDTLLPWRRGEREGKEINTHGVACICPDAATIFIPRHDTTTPATPTPTLRSTSVGVGGQYLREVRNVCVEIKPKQGFLDCSTPGMPLCRYCVKQFLKAGKESGSRSGYCPLDLFSGNMDRMRKAVDNLILAPQNNFKVFVDGQPVDETRPFRYLRDTIIAALTFPFTTTTATTTTSGRLSDRSPLGRILTFQSLDRLGVFRASQLYLTLCDLLGSAEAVDEALCDLSAWPSPALGLVIEQGAQEVREVGEMGVEEMVRLLQSYLLSTTAKDLSLMILLSGPHYSPSPQQVAGSSPFVVLGEEGAWFQCQVTGVDIVAKPTSKILKHQRDYERLRDVLADLRARQEEPPCCRR
ncbi:inositol-pentakisphosphate 2-kinase-like isoform X2 [Portunus trituberculatus]|nr:inositol-pentakisphosphate 2-kinase-like isoform X2 [Portunus trituberculatus]XP_045123331.1 inositol-pentakisphosphate 2-kinase-like isoform X2 [Portunus trituberculatus]XP_045123339.1 inositol-pentakisphosphate 2-kinase-like isoform X2 [Portunus trituberculatus]XP_045123341.1 inositol-pentakisphosphate 2-kinase-like isoform X2 [Portunus trituberculatus]